MATTPLHSAHVPSAPVPTGADITELPALPAVGDPPARVEDSVEAELPIEEVRAEAYRRFLDRGGVHGHDVEDWLAAEEIVRQRT